ncbi:lactadherin-like [Amphiura filiformis]|uniref:lactadherin-like n=1 Tax=Amphiura filiformis TaxID=82378 RepID=UPI003B21BAD6
MFLPDLGRLNTAGAWRPNNNNVQQWIQVQFLRQLPITGIITQGEKGAIAWVTRYKVQYSLDYQTWNFVLDETGVEEMFEANWDDSSPVINYFVSPVTVHYIRINPTLWKTTIALRFELLGCLNEPLPCQDSLGMEDGIIIDQQFSASSNLSDYGVSFARLNGPKAWVFEGSWDQNTPVTHLFYKPVTSSFIRIHPLDWNSGIAMRFELIPNLLLSSVNRSTLQHQPIQDCR